MGWWYGQPFSRQKVAIRLRDGSYMFNVVSDHVLNWDWASNSRYGEEGGGELPHGEKDIIRVALYADDEAF